LDVKVDLAILHQRNPNFGVLDIQNEIAITLDVDEKFVILFRNGSPVKDSPSSRGKNIYFYS